MNGKIVIAAYRAKPGKEQQLHELVKKHVPMLREQSLVTDREAIVMQSGTDTYIEVFEWASAAAIESAHSNESVLAMWGDFAKACEYIPIAKVEEASNLFSEFAPVEIGSTE